MLQAIVELREDQILSPGRQGLRLGATCTDEGVTFVVWAPKPARVELHIVEPEDRVVPMNSDGEGYYSAHVRELGPGTRYFYRLDGERDRPDPASRSQPQGVHGPSEVVDTRAYSAEGWDAPRLRDYIIYELHVGTFTPEGTLDAVIPCLRRLQDLGITALEIMPVAEFPGYRNWGYDGVCPFAVHSAYGGVAALKRLIKACHELGIAVVLDVVYNHFGPEGNYLPEFGPYSTDRYRTPWGQAINVDGPSSDPVRRYFLENAMYWVRDCGVDALRLDAVHAIYDRSSYPFLEELTDVVHSYAAETGRRVYLIAESDLNDARLIRPKEQCGFALDSQWSDEFHHCLHTLLTGERNGYYADFGRVEQFAEALRQGWVYAGQYSEVRARRFGNSPAGLAPEKFVVCSQNHDQVGNRMLGDRLCHLVDWERAKVAAAAVLLAPFTPLLFMGEEYAEPAPFLYHVHHSAPELQSAVRNGRKAEFRDFADQGEAPDPQDETTFENSKLNQRLAAEGRHGVMHALYRELIAVRKKHPALRPETAQSWTVRCHADARAVELTHREGSCSMHVFLNFGERALPYPDGDLGDPILDTADPRWGAEPRARESVVQPFSCVLFGSCSYG